MTPIDIGIVDDSPTFVGLISAAFKSDRQFNVVGQSNNADEARRMLAAAKPDLLTLDVNLPGENGLDLLLGVMKSNPLPIIMVSSLISSNHEIWKEAEARGAFGYVAKPKNKDGLGEFHAQLRETALVAAKQFHMANSKFVRRRMVRKRPSKIVDIIGIAASTGGLQSLDFILKSVPLDGPPIVITQHLQPTFLEKWSCRLNQEHDLDIRLAQDGEILRNGTVRIAPPHNHLEIEKSALGLRTRLVPGRATDIILPAADNMFHSIAANVGDRSIGIVLSGMGKDGAKGALEMRRNGAVCLGEAKETCTVYGMPMQAMRAGAIDAELPIQLIGNHVSEILGYFRAEPRQSTTG